MRRLGSTLLMVALPLGVAACSGTSAGAKPVDSAAAAAVVEATGPADPKGACDKAAFEKHLGVAAGSTDTYLWKPLQAGTFEQGAKDRAQAMKAAAEASALVAKELSAAAPTVAGCPGSVMIVNAVGTGASLATAAGGQFAKGTVNPQTVAGVNSVIGTLTSQAAKIGITVKAVAPSLGAAAG